MRPLLISVHLILVTIPNADVQFLASFGELFPNKIHTVCLTAQIVYLTSPKWRLLWNRKHLYPMNPNSRLQWPGSSVQFRKILLFIHGGKRNCLQRFCWQGFCLGFRPWYSEREDLVFVLSESFLDDQLKPTHFTESDSHILHWAYRIALISIGR